MDKYNEMNTVCALLHRFCVDDFCTNLPTALACVVTQCEIVGCIYGSSPSVRAFTPTPVPIPVQEIPPPVVVPVQVVPPETNGWAFVPILLVMAVLAIYVFAQLLFNVHFGHRRGNDFWTLCARWVLRHFRVRRFSPGTERFARALVTELDVDEDAGEMLDQVFDWADFRDFPAGHARAGQPIRRPRMPGTPYIRKLVDQLKIQFPYMGLRRTEANYRVVYRAAVAAMEHHGLRDTHIARFAPVATAMVFVPSDSEIFARRLEQTVAVQTQVREFDTELVDAPWQEVVPLFGRGGAPSYQRE